MLQVAYYQAEVDNLNEQLNQVKADKARIANDPAEVDLMAKLVSEYVKLEAELKQAEVKLQYAKEQQLQITEAEMKAAAAKASLGSAFNNLFSDNIIQNNAANTVNQMQFANQDIADEVQSSLMVTDFEFSDSVKKAYLENSSMQELSPEEQKEVYNAVEESLMEVQEDYILNQQAYIDEAAEAMERSDFEKAQELLEIAATNARDRADDFDLNMKVNLMAKSLYKGFEKEYGEEYYKNEELLEKLGLSTDDIESLKGATEKEYKEAIKRKLEEKINDQILDKDVSAYDAVFLEENFLGEELKEIWKQASDRAKNTYDNLPPEHMEIITSAKAEEAELLKQAKEMGERAKLEAALNKAKANLGMLEEPYPGAKDEVLAAVVNVKSMQVSGDYSGKQPSQKGQEVDALEKISLSNIQLNLDNSMYQQIVFSEQAQKERNAGFAMGAQDA